MASKYSKTLRESISGILNFEDGKLMTVDVEDVGEVVLATQLAPFAGQVVTISISQKDEF